MAKTLQQQMSEISLGCYRYNYDLTKVRTEEYAGQLDIMLNSELWHDMMERRTKVFKAAMNGDKNAFNQVRKIDDTYAKIVFNTLVNYSLSKQKEENCRTILLRDYFADFVRTDEQKQLYDEYSQRIDAAVFVADVLETMLGNAEEKLKELDPTTLLQEFDGIRKALKVLHDFTYLHHRKEHNDLTSLFCDYAEECEEWLMNKSVLYAKEYYDKREALIASEEIKTKKQQLRSDREWLTERLHDYFYQVGDTKDKVQEAKKKAQKVIAELTDEEFEELMPILSDLSVEQDRIRMARNKLKVIDDSILRSKAADKIVSYFDLELAADIRKQFIAS